jgi:hypothetical protein
MLMGFTSLGALVALAAALPVPGINQATAFRPRNVDSSNLPMLYTRLPGSTRSIATLSYAPGLRNATLQVVVLVQYINLNTQAANDALTVMLLDNLAASLEANAAALGMDSYTLTTEEDTIGGDATPVQAIIATVEVSG